MSLVYGDNIARSWLEIQLNNLGEFAGVKEKQDLQQICETASTLMVEHYDLKITEWMLFFHRLKAGHYGSFYGAVDGMRIGEAILKFRQWRDKELDRIQSQQKREKEAKEREDHDARVQQFRQEGGKQNIQNILADIRKEMAERNKPQDDHDKKLEEFKHKYLRNGEH